MATAVSRSRSADSRGAGPATYVYCLVHGGRAPSMRNLPAGVPGSAPPRLVVVDRSLRAIVSSVPLASFGERAIERGLKDLTWVSACAVAHERVVERFLDRGTVVPMKLFTIFTSDARAMEHVRRERRSIDRLIARLEGRLEFGVRVSVARETRTVSQGHRAASGVEYLRSKQAMHDAARERGRRASERVEEVFQALAEQASESVRRPILETGGGSRRVLLDAAYLVPARRARPFQTAVRRFARVLARDGYDITLSGPWPAYNFIAASS